MMGNPLFGTKKNHQRYGVVDSDDEESLCHKLPKTKDIVDSRHGLIRSPSKNVVLSEPRLARLEESINKLQPTISQLEKSIDQLLIDLDGADVVEGKKNSMQGRDLSKSSENKSTVDVSPASVSVTDKTKRRRKPRSLRVGLKALETDLSSHLMAPRQRPRSSSLTYLPASLSPKASPSSKPKLKIPRKVLDPPSIVDGSSDNSDTATEHRLVKSDHVVQPRIKPENEQGAKSRLCKSSHDIPSSQRRRKTSSLRRSSLGATVEAVSSPKERRSKKALLRRSPVKERAAYLSSLNMASSSSFPKKSPTTPIRKSKRKIKLMKDGSPTSPLSPTSVLAKLGQLDTLKEVEEPPAPPLAASSLRSSPRVIKPRRRSSLHISIYDSPKEGRIEKPPKNLVRAASDTDLSAHSNKTNTNTDEDDMSCRSDGANHNVYLKNENDNGTCWISSPSGHHRHLEINL